MNLRQRVAAELRAEMGFQKLSINDLGTHLGVGYKAAKRRYDGNQELSLDELESASTWLDCSIAQLTTGNRDRDASPIVSKPMKRLGTNASGQTRPLKEG
ncbi:hypothetical protein [Lysinibacter sp. HNR]|uniref:hypothetical protein n=1 Tax=Lysinibacter sp. HNR TaxID=3031408 RepID=UPI0024350B98|nr:hypothetical protein [Lysinibacter sp. HNR]WGD36822.1 hypothetical protein FrondiHNR_10225 [Lysinibacter sp. HNR]